MYGQKETPAQYDARKRRVARREVTKSIIQQAHTQRMSKNYQRAIQEYTRALSIQPNHSNALLYRGHCYRQLDQITQALNDYLLADRYADSGFPKKGELKNSIGRAYLKQGYEQMDTQNYRVAQQSAQSALQYLQGGVGGNKDQSVFHAHVLRADASVGLGKIDYALSYYKEASRLDPENERCLQQQSYCFKKQIEKASLRFRIRYIQEYAQFLRSLSGKLSHEAVWFQDDDRWLRLIEAEGSKVFAKGSPNNQMTKVPAQHIPTVRPTISPFNSGEYKFKDIVLSWTIEEIQREERLTAIRQSYSNPRQYYDAMLPFVLEEAKATLRQGLDEMDKNDNEFTPFIKKVETKGNVSKILIGSLPRRIIDVARSNLALWMTFETPNGRKFECLGLATSYDNEAQIKFINPTSQQRLHIENLRVVYLGSLVTHERMYTVCYEKPESPIVDQISSARLPEWNDNAVHQVISQKLDESQNVAVSQFLASSENSVYLLQGPPGTGKTTTMVELIIESIKRGHRLLVTAPSNKAVQEIAGRLIKEIPEVKAMLAGVEEKLSENLFDIFVHDWHRRILDRFKPIIQQITMCQTLLVLLKKENLEHLKKELNDQLPFVLNAFSKYYPKDQTDHIEVFYEQVWQHIDFIASLENKAQWIEYLRPKKQKKGKKKGKKHEPMPEEPEGFSRCEQISTMFQSLYVRFPDTETQELELLDKSQVIFASLSVCGRHSLARMQQSFDIMIIDEAGQAVPAETLIPLKFFPKKVMFVGDPMQLPATTLSRRSDELGFAESTLSMLMNQNSAPHHLLCYQYRMHPEIRQFPSSHFYSNKLMDGSIIHARTNVLADMNDSIPFFPYGFVNIASGRENKRGNSFENIKEVEALQRLVSAIRTTHPDLQMGIITFYRAQLELIKLNINGDDHLLVSTVDGFQGGERDVILISCVRANSRGIVGFAKDFRRINVAITRARHGLVMLGHIDTLQQQDYVLRDLIEDARNRQRLFTESILPVSERTLSTAKIALSIKEGSGKAEKKMQSVMPAYREPAIARGRGNSRSANRGGKQAASSRTANVPCRFFVRGRCNKGNACGFSHTNKQP